MNNERRLPEGNVPCTFKKYVYKIKDKTQLKEGKNYFVIKKEYEINGFSLLKNYYEKTDINDNIAKTNLLPQEDKIYLNSQYGTILKYDEDVKRKQYFFYELNADYRKKSLLGELPYNLLSDILRTENVKEDVTYRYEVDPIFESHNIYSIKPPSTPIVPLKKVPLPKFFGGILAKGGRKNKKSIKYKTKNTIENKGKHRKSRKHRK
jgi:hypothetical protein